jgi:hypothetical protein
MKMVDGHEDGAWREDRRNPTSSALCKSAWGGQNQGRAGLTSRDWSHQYCH